MHASDVDNEPGDGAQPPRATQALNPATSPRRIAVTLPYCTPIARTHGRSALDSDDEDSDPASVRPKPSTDDLACDDARYPQPIPPRRQMSGNPVGGAYFSRYLLSVHHTNRRPQTRPWVSAVT